MPDPGSGGGGQISHLNLDDGKSPKGLLPLALCRYFANVFCGLSVEGNGNPSGAKQNRLSCHPPFPRYFPLLSLHPDSGMQHHVQNFPFPLTISRITWRLCLRSCPGLLFGTSLLSLNFEPSLDSHWLRVFCSQLLQGMLGEYCAGSKPIMKNKHRVLFHTSLINCK